MTHPAPRKRDSEEWDEVGSLLQHCYGCAATTTGTKAYVFGGKDANSQYLADFQELDMVDNTCRVLPKGPQPKENAVAVRIGRCNTVKTCYLPVVLTPMSVGSDIYIVGGSSSHSCTRPTGSFAASAEMPTPPERVWPRSKASSVSPAGKFTDSARSPGSPIRFK